jgi:orotidine-5'-phosphate decarboxylase
MTDRFADRLAAAVTTRNTALCVGLDPRWDRLPERIRCRHGDSRVGRARAFEEFCFRVLDVVAPLVGVVKPQSAFFEALGPKGMSALFQIVQRARRMGLIVIADVKRNDIASTAEAYAEAAFDWLQADAVTLNPYLGRDSIEPFLEKARPAGRGLFVLVRTSNPGAGQFQDLPCQGEPLHVHVARAVESWAAEHPGRCGLGDVGAVVGCTSPVELTELRRVLSSTWILVPGYGAQGGTAADVAGAFRSDGLGAIVNSSRAVLFPFHPSDSHWEAAVEKAAREAADALRPAVARG